MGAAQRFPINRNHRAIRCRNQPTRPPKKSGFERDRIERGEDPPEDVVRGNAVGQGEKRAEPGAFGDAETGDIDLGIGPADHHAQRDRDEIKQLVAAGTRHPGIGQIAEMGIKVGGGEGIHGGAPDVTRGDERPVSPPARARAAPSFIMRLPCADRCYLRRGRGIPSRHAGWVACTGDESGSPRRKW